MANCRLKVRLVEVTKAVTLTTESFGRLETAAGKNTLAGMAARAESEAITAAMVVLVDWR